MAIADEKCVLTVGVVCSGRAFDETGAKIRRKYGRRSRAEQIHVVVARLD